CESTRPQHRSYVIEQRWGLTDKAPDSRMRSTVRFSLPVHPGLLMEANDHGYTGDRDDPGRLGRDCTRLRSDQHHNANVAWERGAPPGGSPCGHAFPRRRVGQWGTEYPGSATWGRGTRDRPLPRH